MNHSSPLVSVIIPTYNRCNLVQEAIDSVLAQTMPNYEVIVIDDGSTDGTQLALARYEDRIHYKWQENAGESAARNRGISAAQGKYIAFLDSDDIWFPDKLKKQFEFLEKSADVGVVYCLAEKIDAQGRPLPGAPIGKDTLRVPATFENLLTRNLVSAGGSTVVVRSALLKAVDGFDVTLRYGEDWDLWLRLSLRTKLAGIAESLAKIRLHAGGQWWFPRADRIAHVLDDHVRLLERAIAQWANGSAAALRLRDTTLAQEYGKAAWAYYAFGMNNEAQRHLNTAVQLDPATWMSAENAVQQTVHTALALAQMTPSDPDTVPQFIIDLCANLPRSVSLPLEPRQLTVRCDVEIGYHFHAMGQLPLARRHLLRAIRGNPRLLRNRGLAAMLLESFNAQGFVDFVRRRRHLEIVDAYR